MRQHRRSAIRRAMATILMLAILLTMQGQPATADDSSGAAAHVDDVDYAAGFPLVVGKAERGDAEAQYVLGLMHEIGKGTPENDAEAARWYRAAAEQGHAEARFSLGVMYDEGRGTPKNDAEAIRWYRAAAEQGHAKAQFNLGHMYANGDGMPANYVEAYLWVSLAKEGGDSNAGDYLDILEAWVTDDQIAQARARAATFREGLPRR